MFTKIVINLMKLLSLMDYCEKIEPVVILKCIAIWARDRFAVSAQIVVTHSQVFMSLFFLMMPLTVWTPRFLLIDLARQIRTLD